MVAGTAEKFFNTAGPVKGDLNYIVDPLRRVKYDEVEALIRQQRYFVLRAPHQTGKTTSLLAMTKRINDGGSYYCVYMNVESAQTARNDVPSGMQAILSAFTEGVNRFIERPPNIKPVGMLLEEFGGHSALCGALTAFCKKLDKPLVLLIDGVDALIGDTLVSVLRQLCSGYESRPEQFPISAVLCAVRDIRDYHIHQSDGGIVTGENCFSVKAESLRLGDFSESEIMELYGQHATATWQIFEENIYPEVWRLTHGQPWLVNALAATATAKIPEGRDRVKPITLEIIEKAAELLILSRAVHLDQLANTLYEPKVRRVIAPMAAGESWPEDALEKPAPDDVQYVIDLGLLRRLDPDRENELVISNEIYKEIIPRELTAIMQEGMAFCPRLPWYVAADGTLDARKLLREFQHFFRENTKNWGSGFAYKEAGFQLLFQAFLQRILNGGGNIHREYALGRGSVDLLVRWRYPKEAQRGEQLEQRIVIELKTVRKPRSPERALSEGFEQTASYADRADATEAHLVICDERPGTSWDSKIYEHAAWSGSREIVIWGV